VANKGVKVMARHTVTREEIESTLDYYIQIIQDPEGLKGIWINHLGYYMVILNDETKYNDKNLDMAILIYNRL